MLPHYSNDILLQEKKLPGSAINQQKYRRWLVVFLHSLSQVDFHVCLAVSNISVAPFLWILNKSVLGRNMSK